MTLHSASLIASSLPERPWDELSNTHPVQTLDERAPVPRQWRHRATHASRRRAPTARTAWASLQRRRHAQVGDLLCCSNPGMNLQLEGY